MDELLQARADVLAGLAGPHAMRALGGDLYGLHTRAAVVDTDKINKAKMAVPCIITTQDEDRYKDIVVTAGIDCTHHRANPVVLMEHGRGAYGKASTIAQARDGDNYTVALGVGVGRSVSLFSNSIRESEDAYALVEEGLLNAVSIGFRICKAEYRKDHPSKYEGYPGLMIARSELVEYSHCAIGVNPHCLVDRLQKSISGRAWSPHTLQTLAPLLPPLREQVTGGWAPGEEGKAVTTPNTTPAAPAAPANGIPPEWVASVEKVVADAVARAVAAAVPVAVPVAPAPLPAPVLDLDDETKGWPPGAKCLAGLYDLHALAAEYIEEQFRSQENEDVRAALNEATNQGEALCVQLGELFASTYPGLPSPFEVRALDGQDETDEQAAHNESARARQQARLATLKAARDAKQRQFAPTQTAKGTLASASATLAELSGLPGLSETQRAACVALSATVKGLAEAPATPDDVEQLRTENARLKAGLAEADRTTRLIQKELTRLRRGR